MSSAVELLSNEAQTVLKIRMRELSKKSLSLKIG